LVTSGPFLYHLWYMIGVEATAVFFYRKLKGRGKFFTGGPLWIPKFTNGVNGQQVDGLFA